MGYHTRLAVVLALTIALAGCTPGSGLTSLPFGKCKLPNGAQSYGYTFNNDGACFATPKTIAITNLVSFNSSLNTMTIWNDNGASVTLPGVVQPRDVTMAAGGISLYVLDSSDSNQRIALIDPQTGKITAQIPLPPAGYSSSAIAVSPDGKFLYVTKGKDLSVSTTPPTVVVVNLTTNKVDAEISLPATVAPQGGLAITPDSAIAYVPVADAVYVIDTSARKVATIIQFPDSASPVNIAVTPDGTTVYVARQTSLLAIDVLTNTIAANIPFPAPVALNRIVIDPAGRYVYVTNQGPNIAIVDAITNRYVDQIKVAPMVTGNTSLRISSDGRLLYSIDKGDPFVNLIDTVSRTVLSRTRVATFPVGQTGWNLFDVLPLQ
jgi:DNA-binding beta-propeller fold protein YncE